MKNALNNIKNNVRIILVSVIFVVFGFTIVSAAETLFESDDVSYDNSSSGLIAGNVQDALDELYTKSTDYSYTDTKFQYIKSLTVENASFHNLIFRGKDVTNYYTDGSLYTRILDGSFDDLYVGDYIVVNDVIWRIAGFDIYYGKGSTALLTHHAVIVPDTMLTTARMNTTNTTVGGYVGSEMYTVTLPNVFNSYVSPVFGNHVLEYWTLLSNIIDTSAINRTGRATGAAFDWIWVSRKIDLMNEVQVFGTIAWSSSGIDVGPDNIQFPLFRLRPMYINVQRNCYWLRTIVCEQEYADVELDGLAGLYLASLTNNPFTNQGFGVRPYFYID